MLQFATVQYQLHSALLGSKPTATEPCPDWADTLPMDIDLIPDLSAVPESKSLPDAFVPEVPDSQPRSDSPCVDDKPDKTGGDDQPESHKVCELGMAMSIQHIYRFWKLTTMYIYVEL